MRPRTTQLSYHLAVFIGLAAMHSMVHGSPAADPAEAAVSAGPDTHALAGTPQTFSGRLMTLFHFAGGDRPRPSQWLNPPPNPENGQQSRDWKNDSVTPATPAAVVAAAPKGSLGSSTNLTPAGVPPPPRAGTWGGQALALVVSSATAAAVSAPAQQPYILVFDPLNSASRSSFARAQWILAGRGQEVDLGSVTGSAPGKKEVRERTRDRPRLRRNPAPKPRPLPQGSAGGSIQIPRRNSRPRPLRPGLAPILLKGRLTSGRSRCASPGGFCTTRLWRPSWSRKSLNCRQRGTLRPGVMTFNQADRCGERLSSPG